MNAKEFVMMLSHGKAGIIIADCDGDGGKQYVFRRVTGYYSHRQGKYTYYGVELDAPLSDGVESIDGRFVLAYNTPEHFDLTKLCDDLMIERKRELLDIDMLNINCSEAIHKLGLGFIRHFE